MINKQMYEAPEAELIVISLEEQFLESILTTQDSGFDETASTTDMNDTENLGIWNWE